MKEEIEQLLEDYKRRLHTVNQMIADTVFFVRKNFKRINYE
jgi:hypothetical protein